jgi:type II secretory ATPase GspE/PulE/Tfp pilus assembly ATPase PilB-like protein
MMAGTFNSVIAQRLTKKICTNCQVEISIKDKEIYKRAKESFANMDKNALKQEIVKRNISSEQRTKFIND